MAACASFLKPLVGRLLKINSSAGYSYPTNPYNRSGRTPMGPAEAIGSKYASRGRGNRSQHDDLDEFELHTKDRTVTRVQGARSPAGTSQDYSSAEAVDAVPSDTNSEEIILQKQETVKGIMRTRDVTVRYSSNK